MKPKKHLDESVVTIEFIRQQYLDYNIGRYAVVERSSNNFVGWSGLKFINGPLNKHQDFYELGYRFIKKHWGKGYATEAGQAWINYGFSLLKLHEIFAMAHSENLASRKVLLKCGMKDTGNLSLMKSCIDGLKLLRLTHAAFR